MQPFSVSPHNEPQPPKRKRTSLGAIAGVAGALVVVVIAAVIVVSNGGGDSPSPTTLPPGIETVPPGETTTVATTPTTQVTHSSAPSAEPDLVGDSCTEETLFARECQTMKARRFADAGRLPTVILLHGLGGSPVDVRGAGLWGNALEARPFLLVTPGGVVGSWNAGSCCGVASATQTDDVGYLSGLITRLVQRPDVDPERIYLVGHSNGGLMTYRYLCADAGRLAGAVSFAGTRTVDCMPSAPIDVLQIHGTTDDTVPYNGGQGLIAALHGVTFAGVETTMTALANGMHCAATPSVTENGTVTERRWADCPDGTHVDLWTINGWGHEWMVQPYNMTDRVLDYFGIAAG